MSLQSTQKEKVKGGIEGGGVKDSSMGASLNSCKKRSMRVEEAESLVKQWQTVKAEALGPNHQLHNLVDVLDGSMLLQVSNVFALGMFLFNLMVTKG